MLLDKKVRGAKVWAHKNSKPTEFENLKVTVRQDWGVNVKGQTLALHCLCDSSWLLARWWNYEPSYVITRISLPVFPSNAKSSALLPGTLPGDCRMAWLSVEALALKNDTLQLWTWDLGLTVIAWSCPERAACKAISFKFQAIKKADNIGVAVCISLNKCFTGTQSTWLSLQTIMYWAALNSSHHICQRWWNAWSRHGNPFSSHYCNPYQPSLQADHGTLTQLNEEIQ